MGSGYIVAVPPRAPDPTLSPIPAGTEDSGSATFTADPVPEPTPDNTLPAATEIPNRYVATQSTGPVQLGVGGLGRVLVYRDRILGRSVARKELLPKAFSQSTSFLREARVTAQLEHPNIVPIYELGTNSDGQPYYTMKWVRGRSLYDALQKSATLSDRLKLLGHFVDVCNAVAYAHARGVIHRDLKPHNIMVGEFGETVVLDWGLARTQSSSDVTNELGELVAPVTTLYGTIKGTPSYMSPEQARGETDRINEPSDIWSLGAILYHILSARPPFEGTTSQVLAMVSTLPVQAVQKYCPEAPPELAAIALKALSRDPSSRYQSAQELSNEVEAWQNGGLVKAYDYSSWELLVRVWKQHRTAFLVGTVATLVLIISMTAAGWQIVQKEHLANLNLAEAYTQRALASLAEGNMPDAQSQAILALEQQERADARGVVVAAVSAWNPQLIARSRLPSSPQLSIRQIALGSKGLSMATTQGLFLPPGLPRIEEPVVAVLEVSTESEVPRYQYVTRRARIRQLVGSQTQTLAELRVNTDTALIDSAGGTYVVTPHSLQRVEPDGALGWVVESLQESTRGDILVLSPDQSLLVWGHRDGTLHLISTKDGALQAPLGDSWPGASVVAFSPDGKMLATAGTEDGLNNDIHLWDVSSRQLVRTLVGPDAAVSMLGFDAQGEILVTGAKDRMVRFWNVATGELMAVRKPFGSRPVAMVQNATSPSQISLVASNGELVSYVLPPIKSSFPRSYRTQYAAFSRSGQYLATSSFSGELELWDMFSGNRLFSSRGNGVARPVSVDNRGRLAWADGSGLVHILEPSGEESQVLVSYRPSPMLMSPVQPRVLLWQNQQRQMEAWEDGKMLWSREDPDSMVKANFSPDGKLLAMASEDRVTILAADSGKTEGVITDVEGRQIAEWSDEGTLVVSTPGFGIKLIDVEKLNTKLVFQGNHGDHILSACFAGDVLVTSSRDRTMKLWDLVDGELLASISTGEEDVVWLSCQEQQVLGLSTDGGGIRLDLGRLRLPVSELRQLLRFAHGLELSSVWGELAWGS